MQNRYTHINRREFSLKVHIALVTKYRKTLLVNGIDDFAKRACHYIAGQHNWNIIAMETDKDHIHILLEYDTKESVCDIISILKQQATHYLWIKHSGFLKRHYWKKHIFWSDGYFACSIDEVSASTIQKYIESQG